MMYYPGAFKKANEEIVRVIGTERLPTFDDRASLPYCMCPIFLPYPHLLTLTCLSGMHFQ